MRFMLLIEKRYGVDLPMAALIETPTVEGLAERLRERSAVRAFDPLVPIRAGGSRPPLFLVHPLGGHVLCYLPLVRALPPDQPVYALQAAGTGQGSTPLAVLEDIAASYLAAIRRVQPEGPYHLGGWSFGGFVAYEMARQLRALDPQAVAQLIVLDSITVDRNHAGSASDEALLLFFYWELVWFSAATRRSSRCLKARAWSRSSTTSSNAPSRPAYFPPAPRAPPCSGSTSCSGRAGRHSSAIARKSATRT